MVKLAGFTSLCKKLMPDNSVSVQMFRQATLEDSPFVVHIFQRFKHVQANLH